MIITVFIIFIVLIFCLFVLPNTPIECSDKELFDKFGTTYLNDLKKQIEDIKKDRDYYKKQNEKLLNKIDTCVLIFEEYFAQDQTNDDLLVTAFEQLHSISDLTIEGFCTDQDTKRVLRKGLSVIQLEMQKLKLRKGE